LVQSIHVSAYKRPTHHRSIHFFTHHQQHNHVSLSSQNRSNTEKSDEHVEVHQELHRPRTLTNFLRFQSIINTESSLTINVTKSRKTPEITSIANQFANCSSTTTIRELKLNSSIKITQIRV
jgi:hypothetical protein